MLKRGAAVEGEAEGGEPLHMGSSNNLFKRGFERFLALGPLFMITVALPTILATIYYGLLASDIYVSESRFVVRAPDRPAANGLGMLLRSAGWSNGGSEVYAARDYVLSRDAMDDLNKDGAVAKAYSSGSISIFDRFDPLGWNGSNEDLFRYYLKKVSMTYDSTSAITTLQVRAYTADDAHRFNEFLLHRAETLVNSLNKRAQSDLVKLAEGEVKVAKEKALKTALALAEFRDRSGVVDPEQQASMKLQMVSKLQDELIAARMRLVQLRKLTPDNPQIAVLENGVQNLERQIEEEAAKVAGGKQSLADSSVRYQRLLVDNQFAEKQLGAAMTAYEEARNETLRQQAYVEHIVDPNFPDDALEPRRFRGILTALVTGLVAWGVISMLIAGVREHRD